MKSAFEAGENLAIVRPRSNPEDYIGEGETNALVYCWLVQAKISKMCFSAVSGMKDLIRMKGRAAGKNTDRLGDRNCHIWLGEEESKVLGSNWAVIAKDKACYRWAVRTCRLLTPTLS